jgi:Uma2 family endonuclease
MVTTDRLLSADDLWAIQADEQAAASSDRRFELVRGELIEMTPASGLHGIVAGEIGALLRNYIYTHKLGYFFAAETGFLLARDPDVVRAPDAAFVAWERVPDPNPDRFWPVAPDLAVEVVSPSDRAADVQSRVNDFLAAGSRLVWVIYPDTLIAAVYYPGGEARILPREGVLDGSPVLPGLRIPLADLVPPRRPAQP